MNKEWLEVIQIGTLVLTFIWLSLFIFLANIIKSRIKVLKNFIIPTSVIAGFIGLILGPDIINLVPIDSNHLGSLVYHLMAVGFIALALKDRNKNINKSFLNSGILIVSTYLIQGIIGFSISLILFYTIFPDLFVGFGLLLPLGYGQGPGQAFSIGTTWEELGFIYGGSIGLTIATFGFLWASLIGIPLMNFLRRRNKIKKHDSNVNNPRVKIYEESDPEEIPLSEGLDKISIQISMIGIVYLATVLTLVGLSKILYPLGEIGQTISDLLWGFHFTIGSVYGILAKTIWDKLRKRNIIIYSKPNNYLLQRIAGGAFDFMITASIAAISIQALKDYVTPIILITTIGGIVTALYVIFMCKKLFKNNTLENIVGFFGMLTGTISTGMALLRGIDPSFDSDGAENLVMGSAVGLFFGFPLMIALSLPITGYKTGQPIFYLYTLLLFIVYLLFLFGVLYIKNRKNKS